MAIRLKYSSPAMDLMGGGVAEAGTHCKSRNPGSKGLVDRGLPSAATISFLACSFVTMISPFIVRVGPSR